MHERVFNGLCLVVSCLPMLEQRITNLTINGVFDILNFIVYPLSLCSLKYVPLFTVFSRTKEVLVGQLLNDAQRTAKLIQNSVLNIMKLIPLYILVKSFPLSVILFGNFYRLIWESFPIQNWPLFSHFHVFLHLFSHFL